MSSGKWQHWEGVLLDLAEGGSKGGGGTGGSHRKLGRDAERPLRPSSAVTVLGVRVVRMEVHCSRQKRQWKLVVVVKYL